VPRQCVSRATEPQVSRCNTTDVDRRGPCTTASVPAGDAVRRSVYIPCYGARRSSALAAGSESAILDVDRRGNTFTNTESSGRTLTRACPLARRQASAGRRTVRSRGRVSRLANIRSFALVFPQSDCGGVRVEKVFPALPLPPPFRLRHACVRFIWTFR
jgi:hypothetical protein